MVNFARFLPLTLFLLTSFVFIYKIDAFPLRNWDEAWYAEIANNMASGQHGFLVPFWNGQYYFDKPPLYFWLSMPFFVLFGSGEWQARIVSVVTAVGTVMLIFVIGKRLFSQSAGLFATIIFLTLGQVFVRLSHGNLDALLIFLQLGAFYSYLLSKNDSRFTFVCGISIGLGFLVKGWGLGLLPVIFIAVYELFATHALPKQWVKLLLTISLVSGWWFIFGVWQFGKPFFDQYLLHPLAGQLNSPIASLSTDYLSFFARDTGLWWIVAGIVVLGYRQLSTAHFKVLAFLSFVGFSYVFAINFLNDKFDWYLLPVYPLFALYFGYCASLLVKRTRFLLGIIAVIAIFEAFLTHKIEMIYPDRSRIGAQLGVFGQRNIPGSVTLVLDDRDFTSFLFYSQTSSAYSRHRDLFVVTPGGGKSGEWWMLSYSDFQEFLKTHENVVLVSSNPSDIPGTSKGKKEAVYSGYSFVRF